MSFSIFDRGDGRFDLMRGDAEIGWIADRAIGFAGFANAAAARRAAAIAHNALTGWLARQRRVDTAPRNAGALRVRRNGAVEQLTLGDVSVGRLFPHGGDSGGGQEYAFELLLPPRVGASVSAAQVMYLALTRHGFLGERMRRVLLV
jgi:hypothetical protein